MFSPEQSLYAPPHRKITISPGSNSGTGERDIYTKPCDMMALYQHAGYMEFGRETYFCDPASLTMVLHGGEANMPTITLTTFKDNSLTLPSLLQLFSTVKPSRDESITNSFRDAFANMSEQVDEKNKTLIYELQEHFEGLKGKFEEKTGRTWTPLRAWEKEVWDWDSEEEVCERLCILEELEA